MLTYNGDTPFGLHAFSTTNGRTWHAFLDFGEANNSGSNTSDGYPAEWAYEPTAHYTDGTNVTYLTAERPHLILADDSHTPLALTNGARPPNSGDYSVTILRPINQD